MYESRGILQIAFVANALEAVCYAQQGELVVFGIQPTAPETSFGYIKVEKVGLQNQAVLSFSEKPDQASTIEYLASGRYYWSSGMFCFTAGALLDAMGLHAPEVLAAAETQCRPHVVKSPRREVLSA